MLSFLEAFRFRRRTSIIHRLDPRVKGFYVLAVTILAVLYYTVEAMLTIFLSVIPLILAARVQREWIRSLRGASILTVFIVAVNLASGFLGAGFKLTWDTILFSLSMGLRFIVFTSAFSVFFLTTTPEDLGLALEKLRIPYDYCFAFSSAIRFVPDLALEIQSVIDAQRSRGLELEKGGFLRRIRNYIPILVPVFVRSFTRSIELAEAMESRGYGASDRRTSLYELRMGKIDYLASTLIASTLTLGVTLKFYLGLG